jgi:hypothetical protein
MVLSLAFLFTQESHYISKLSNMSRIYLLLLGSITLSATGITLQLLHAHPLAVFATNVSAIVPLASLLRQSTGEFVWWLQCPPHLDHGHALGGLLDMLLGWDLLSSAVEGITNTQVVTAPS